MLVRVLLIYKAASVGRIVRSWFIISLDCWLQQYKILPMTVLLEYVTALLEYIDLNFRDFAYYANYALKYLQYAGIIPDSFTTSLCSKLSRHNSRTPTDD